MNVTSGPTVDIELAGAKVAIPSNTIAELWLERLRDGARAIEVHPLLAPKIGAAWLGGTYMGVVRGHEGGPDHHLIDMGEAAATMNWADAKKWAEDQGGSLPTRREQSVMFGNRAEGQYKQEWYWSCEQYAGSDDFAWVQDFDYGTQDYGHKSDYCRARAVRRLTIQ